MTNKIEHADILRKVPEFNATGLVTRDQLSLIWMNTDIVD